MFCVCFGEMECSCEFLRLFIELRGEKYLILVLKLVKDYLVSIYLLLIIKIILFKKLGWEVVIIVYLVLICSEVK